ncbi:MAG TPA: Uma2 family endonuclease [Acetobacteraceae bacterium]|nr:Uma2 family endonuclease [Acetobacteraceae bacterium]
MTREAFLEWEVRQPLRYEFDGFQPVAMAGGTEEHAAIQRNLAIAVGGRLRGKPCRFYGSDLKVDTAETYRYPDGFVVCTPAIRRRTTIDDPVVIFEITSDESAQRDLFVKNREYAAMSSVRRYIVLAQDSMAGIMYERIGTDWVGRLLNADMILHMPEIEIEVPLAELYEGVDLVPADSAAAASQAD